MKDNKREILVELKNLNKHFKVGKNKVLKAVEDVNLNIYKGETLGLVGESGCGKTTCGRTVINLYKPTSGQVIYDGIDTKTLKSKEIRAFRKKVQMIFQDPYASLDPKMTIGDIIAEGIRVHFKGMSEKQIQERVTELLKTVGLNAEHSARFPRELSGGQRQRIGIARALAIEPDFIVCDEPISALDVSIQAQVVNLLIDLQKKKGLTYLFISHDLSMIKHISDRIGVMYLGSLVEISPSGSLYKKPLHPYTRALISAIPIPDPNVKSSDRIKLEGEIPSPIDAPEGCKFSTRCRYALDRCRKDRPSLVEVEPEHFVACHLFENGIKKGMDLL
ncbi:MAG: oligopeptide/dipeptide ABC transporter ATP-binding protein [Peptostreptococcus porci]|uniref:ABC transporter ATP-binding protein n=2 Tax=Peptostreptococcus porci TaxID=2652282 RepID=UPI002A7478CF|nr:oligopeptide/dipeptide ABC transporter ATP-binding protein [Peptostreptococcus porci]MDY2794828.1 oligopeptide/dipeptide ABC transporter ATP-binding protein [Peptostreptococcus porci]MDY4561062.1 oligopeptide/dipeptide ABC transporter ATP-binding protein [Peptostreptococcus porci]MDY5480135.1 oligopeptide/dipeptide ABC transporter ATP-binding protein [Peptostreptococcus porci]